MKTNEILLTNYKAPRIQSIPMEPEDVLCGSPVSGGNEDVGYDDWEDEG